MKVFPYFLMAGAMALGTACSSTNTGSGTAGTTGGSTDAGSYSSASGTATGTSTSGAAGGAGMGSTSGTAGGSTSGMAGGSTSGTAGGSTSGMAGGSTSGTAGGSTGGSAGMGASGATSGTATSGTDAAADPTAFMATFATMQDPVFLMNAASSNLLEIKAGQMASQKATNPEVRKFAQMMVGHHTTATQELKAVAMPLGVTLPQIMMPVHQALADRLMNKSGKGFDEAYMDMMEAAHKLDIAMFEVKSKAAEKPTVQAFATKTLPMLRSHHTMADNLEKKVD
ncbi:DUF4142 domain-containing protein [Hymenobacter sp. B1770]|uniref:DUF4142 domain-containing protein n=1 Tax=Hymenobacter sp. B1770 TaxID=1718788 RepID=UPI003CFB64D8